MDDSIYDSVCSELDLLIKFGADLSNSLANKDALGDREYYGERVFSKLLCHAITLRRIVPSGLTPKEKGRSELWDISSVCTLARALIESYDAFFYIAVDEVEDSESDFRVLLWNLYSEERRLKKLSLIGSKAPQIENISGKVVDLRQNVTRHEFFSEINSNIQKRIDKCDAPAFYLSHSERNARASVNHSYYNSCIMFLFAYVHTFPFSINQLFRFKAGDPESLQIMSVPIQYATGFLSKGVDGMSHIFKGHVPEAPDEVSDLCLVWGGVIKNGIQEIA
jgi:hypothetical protein